jgi:hypothetical protein
MGSKKSTSQHDRPNLFGATRDVLISSMTKGQFPLALMGLIILAIILKMPADDVSKLAFELFKALELHYISGYILSVVALGSWFFHSRWQRKQIITEMRRIAFERNRWQKGQLGNAIESSES